MCQHQWTSHGERVGCMACHSAGCQSWQAGTITKAGSSPALSLPPCCFNVGRNLASKHSLMAYLLTERQEEEDIYAEAAAGREGDR